MFHANTCIRSSPCPYASHTSSSHLRVNFHRVNSSVDASKIVVRDPPRDPRGIDVSSISPPFHRYLWGRYRSSGDVGNHFHDARRVAPAHLRTCFAMMHEGTNGEEGYHERSEEDDQVRTDARLGSTSRTRSTDARTSGRTKHDTTVKVQTTQLEEARAFCEGMEWRIRTGTHSVRSKLWRNARATRREADPTVFGHVSKFAVVVAQLQQVGRERDVFG